MKKIITWACCENCGSDCIEVDTDCKGEELVHDGDSLTCLECGEKGWVSIDEEDGVDYWECNSKNG